MAWHRCLTNNGNGGGMKKTLLWTNPAPTTNFSGKTLDLGLGDYDYVEIVVRHTTSIVSAESKIVKREDMSAYGSLSCGNSENATAPNSRRYKIAGNSILFTTGFLISGGASAGPCIPITIYGIKGEITE